MFFEVSPKTDRSITTTFSKTLATVLQTKINRLVGNEPEIADRIILRSIKSIGEELYMKDNGKPNIVPETTLQELLVEKAASLGTYRFTNQFLLGEWADVVDAWQLKSWEQYRDVQRLGRKTRVGGKQREVLWAIFEEVRTELAETKAMTWSDLFGHLTDQILESGNSPFDFSVVDEAQDLGVVEVRFLAAMGAERPDGLFFAGDLGQRIFQQPFSWKSLGVDIRGRSNILKINYRTSHQIRSHADRLLPPALSDVDGNSESRRGTVSVFNGPGPEIKILDSENEEITNVADWISQRLEEGFQPHEVGVFVRTDPEHSF
jgi:superfamily I DNA/RNA helicase